MLVLAICILRSLHPREVFLKLCDFAVNAIHDLDESCFSRLFGVANRSGFVGVLLKEVSSKSVKFFNLALIFILHPLEVEFADFGCVHSLTKLNISLLDLSYLLLGIMGLEPKHVIYSRITDFLELIHSPFSILEGRLGSIQSLASQIDSVYLGK